MISCFICSTGLRIMEKTPRCSALPLLVTLAVFLLSAVEFGGAEDPNGAPTHVRIQASCTDWDADEERLGGCFNALMSGTPQVKSEPRVSGGEVKRLDDVNYDSFVGLMGRRRNAEPDREFFPPQPPPHTGARLIYTL